LRSYHTFSFADYFDAEHVEFGPLRVINQDRVQPGAGFGTHSHRDMEIITYVLEGALEHKDSLGNGSIIRPGDVQRMSAGTGVRHSEFNASATESVHFLQIWIQPNRHGIAPSYEERHFDPALRRGRLRLICSPQGQGDSVRIHQDAQIYAGLFDGEEAASLAIAADRRGYVHVARGEVTVSGTALREGDGVKFLQERGLEVSHGKGAEVLVFDLP
jgi:redox-sensitive bicupin YhaK (pirin superfamily)